MDKLISQLFAGLFGILAIAAIFAALFFSATHQVLVGVMSAIMCAMLVYDIKQSKKSEK